MVNMIILDTAIWIEYLRNNNTYHNIVDQLLYDQKLLLPGIILAELYYGSFKEEIFNIQLLAQSSKPISEQGLVIESSLYAQKHNFRNKGIGLADSIIIYATIENDAQLWTLDKKIISFLDDKYLFKI